MEIVTHAMIVLWMITYAINDEDFSCARHCSEFIIFIISFSPYATPTRHMGVMSPVVQKGKQRRREVKSLDQGFRSIKWQSWELNPSSSALAPTFLEQLLQRHLTFKQVKGAQGWPVWMEVPEEAREHTQGQSKNFILISASVVAPSHVGSCRPMVRC